MLATISPLRILPYTYEIAEMAGKIARDLKQPLEFADVAIAATALFNWRKNLDFKQKTFCKNRRVGVGMIQCGLTKIYFYPRHWDEES